MSLERISRSNFSGGILGTKGSHRRQKDLSLCLKDCNNRVLGYDGSLDTRNRVNHGEGPLGDVGPGIHIREFFILGEKYWLYYTPWHYASYHGAGTTESGVSTYPEVPSFVTEESEIGNISGSFYSNLGFSALPLSQLFGVTRISGGRQVEFTQGLANIPFFNLFHPAFQFGVDGIPYYGPGYYPNSTNTALSVNGFDVNVTSSNPFLALRKLGRLDQRRSSYLHNVFTIVDERGEVLVGDRSHSIRSVESADPVYGDNLPASRFDTLQDTSPMREYLKTAMYSRCLYRDVNGAGVTRDWGTILTSNIPDTDTISFEAGVNLSNTAVSPDKYNVDYDIVSQGDRVLIYDRAGTTDAVVFNPKGIRLRYFGDAYVDGLATPSRAPRYTPVHNPPVHRRIYGTSRIASTPYGRLLWFNRRRGSDTAAANASTFASNNYAESDADPASMTTNFSDLNKRVSFDRQLIYGEEVQGATDIIRAGPNMVNIPAFMNDSVAITVLEAKTEDAIFSVIKAPSSQGVDVYTQIAQTPRRPINLAHILYSTMASQGEKITDADQFIIDEFNTEYTIQIEADNPFPIWGANQGRLFVVLDGQLKVSSLSSNEAEEDRVFAFPAAMPDDGGEEDMEEEDMEEEDMEYLNSTSSFQSLVPFSLDKDLLWSGTYENNFILAFSDVLLLYSQEVAIDSRETPLPTIFTYARTAAVPLVRMRNYMYIVTADRRQVQRFEASFQHNNQYVRIPSSHALKQDWLSRSKIKTMVAHPSEDAILLQLEDGTLFYGYVFADGSVGWTRLTPPFFGPSSILFVGGQELSYSGLNGKTYYLSGEDSDVIEESVTSRVEFPSGGLHDKTDEVYHAQKGRTKKHSLILNAAEGTEVRLGDSSRVRTEYNLRGLEVVDHMEELGEPTSGLVVEIVDTAKSSLIKVESILETEGSRADVRDIARYQLQRDLVDYDVLTSYRR